MTMLDEYGQPSEDQILWWGEANAANEDGAATLAGEIEAGQAEQAETEPMAPAMPGTYGAATTEQLGDDARHYVVWSDLHSGWCQGFEAIGYTDLLAMAGRFTHQQAEQIIQRIDDEGDRGDLVPNRLAHILLAPEDTA